MLQGRCVDNFSFKSFKLSEKSQHSSLVTRFAVATLCVSLVLALSAFIQVNQPGYYPFIVLVPFAAIASFVILFVFVEVNAIQDELNKNEQGISQVLLRERTERFVKDEAFKVMNAQMNDVKELRQKAKQAEQAKGLFLSNMSHEIRTPLVSVLGYAELLREPDITLETAKNYGAIIERTGNNLLEIMNDILDLSKAEAGQLLIENSSFKISELIDELSALFELKADEKSLQFIVEGQDCLPQKIISDSSRVRQILMILLNNALKFTNSGYVKLICKIENEGLIFYIEDSGVGMSAIQQEQLFQNFNQGDNSISRRYSGMGLGLSLSRQLAKKIGGEVHLLNTDVDRGTTFAFKIPVVIPNPKETDEFQKQLSLNIYDPYFTEKSVLVVDDSFDNQLLIKKILTDWGFEVILANNGQEAIDAVNLQNFDLILMDMQMPIKDGYTACQELVANHCDIPIVALTANAMKEDRDRCLKAGCTDYLSKPIKKSQLFLTIKKNLQPSYA